MNNDKILNKFELGFLAKVGEAKIKSIKVSYELTESELLHILKLHRKTNLDTSQFIDKLL